MRIVILISLWLCSMAVWPAERNLVANGGFEAGMAGWSAFWAREPGAGEAAPEAGNARSGKGSIRIVHRGSQDWAVQQEKAVPVRPGEILEIRGWARAAKLANSLTASVVLMGPKGEVIDWTYGSASARLSQSWQPMRRRFAVPEGAVSARFRLVGVGECDARLDDLSLVRAGTVRIFSKWQPLTPVAFGRDSLRVVFNPRTLALRVTDTASGRVWQQAPASRRLAIQGLALEPSRLALRLYDALSDLTFQAVFSIPSQEKQLQVAITAPSGAKLEEDISYPSPFYTGDRDYIVLPYASGMILPVLETDLARSFDYYGYKTTMGWAGATDLKAGVALFWDTPADAGVGVVPLLRDGRHRLALQMRWLPSKGRFGYTRKLSYRFFTGGGYVAMAKTYRQRMLAKGWLLPFSRKAKNRKHLGRLFGAVDLWNLDGQLQNAAFYRELADFGIDRIVGSLGENRPLVESLNRMGYLPGHYDIYTDTWDQKENPPTPWVEGYPQDVIVRADGSLQTGWLIKGEKRNYQGYYMCALTHAPKAWKRLKADLARIPYRSMFVDVETASTLFECYSPRHPATRAQDAAARAKLLSVHATGFNLVSGSEEAREWAMPYADYAEGTMTLQAHSNAGYDWTSPVEGEPAFLKFNADAVYRVPLHGLVFHEGHVASWYTGDGQMKVPSAWQRKDLLNILYGSMPLWSLNRTLYETYKTRLVTSYHNVGTVFAEVGRDEMTYHAFLTPDRKAQTTRFSSGAQVIANFGPEPYPLPEPLRLRSGVRQLAPDGFLALGKGWLACRFLADGRTVNAVVTPRKRLIEAGGRFYARAGLGTDGTALFLKCGSKTARLWNLGPASAVSLEPALLFPGATGQTLRLAAIGSDGKPGAEVELTKRGGAWIARLPAGPVRYELRWE